MKRSLLALLCGLLVFSSGCGSARLIKKIVKKVANTSSVQDTKEEKTLLDEFMKEREEEADLSETDHSFGEESGQSASIETQEVMSFENLLLYEDDNIAITLKEIREQEADLVPEGESFEFPLETVVKKGEKEVLIGIQSIVLNDLVYKDYLRMGYTFGNGIDTLNFYLDPREYQYFKKLQGDVPVSKMMWRFKVGFLDEYGEITESYEACSKEFCLSGVATVPLNTEQYEVVYQNEYETIYDTGIAYAFDEEVYWGWLVEFHNLPEEYVHHSLGEIAFIENEESWDWNFDNVIRLSGLAYSRELQNNQYAPVLLMPEIEKITMLKDKEQVLLYFFQLSLDSYHIENGQTKWKGYLDCGEIEEYIDYTQKYKNFADVVETEMKNES